MKFSFVFFVSLYSPVATNGKIITEELLQRHCQGICFGVHNAGATDVFDPVCGDAKEASPNPTSHRICTEYLKQAQRSCINMCNDVGAEAVKRDGGEINAMDPLYTPAVLDVEKVCANNKPGLPTALQRLHSTWCRHAYPEGFRILSELIQREARLIFKLPPLEDSNDEAAAAQGELLAKEKEAQMAKLEEEKKRAEQLAEDEAARKRAVQLAKDEAEKVAVEEEKLVEEAKVLAEQRAAEEKLVSEKIEAARVVEEERAKQQELAIEVKRMEEQVKVEAAKFATEQAAATKQQEVDTEAAALSAAQAEIAP